MNLEVLLHIINGLILLNVSRRFSLYHPVKVWMLFQVLFYFGTIYITDFTREVEVSHLRMYAVFALVTYLTALLLPKDKEDFKVQITDVHIRFVYISFYVSIIMCSIYFTLAGGNLFVQNIKSLVSLGSTLDFVGSRRLEFYAGQNYYAPGFFNLFKNFLLPASFYALLFLHIKGYKRRPKWFIAGALVAYLIFILGTGQRGALVLSILFGVVYCYHFLGKKRTYRIGLYGGVGFFVLFVVATFFLSRAKLQGLNSLDDYLLLVEVSMERFFVTNQRAGLIAYQYILTYEEITYGYDWLMSLEQFLPGQSTHINLANKVFAYRYGSTRGTSPPTLMVSVFYNFGYFGVVVFPILFLGFLQGLYSYFRSRYKGFLDLFVYSFLYFGLATWATGSLSFPILNGGLLFILLYFIKKVKI
ncbi:O-antigen polymerase [Gilvibacter sediminis]|uniref:O-antigen polymerase n=1 Tax=Gilvibacter sediminis TaxID=379071 RepID=UPI0023507E9D|nr:O-antigen polymerase [Gilvibacter sediminis]MDC7999122.1 O-antigen ligase [Gilvibacter sediminis]